MDSLSDHAHTADRLAEPAPRFTPGQWAELVDHATLQAWKRSGVTGEYSELYRVIYQALADALPDRVPVDGDHH